MTFPTKKLTGKIELLVNVTGLTELGSLQLKIGTYRYVIHTHALGYNTSIKQQTFMYNFA